ncbi:MAG: hypothetical protein LC659_07530 [Myxococcales bacterium]|nr:hypothetical protein [Myxococcales bacterium]
MGLELTVESARPLAEALAALADVSIVMIDGALVMPGAAPPATWSDVRVKTAAGTFALKRRGDAVGIVAFGNADAAARAMQEQLAAALRR